MTIRNHSFPGWGLGLIVLLHVTPRVGEAYPWPLAPTDQVHGVNGTIGEFRKSGDVYSFHAGVDMQAGLGITVFSVAPGVVKRGQTSIRVGKFRYVHTDNFQYKDGDILPVSGVWIANVGPYNTGPHLHFEEMIDETSTVTRLNPLRPDALNPPAETQTAYDPATWPQVISINLKRDSVDGQTGVFFGPADTIYGAVDVVARARDLFPGGTVNAGVYRMTYKILDAQGTVTLSPQSFAFDAPPSNIYVPRYYQITEGFMSNNSTFYCLPTNWNNSLPAEPPSWFTKQMKEAAPSVEARINREARFQDGQITLIVAAYDRAGNGGNEDTGNPATSWKGAKRLGITLNNFAPYCERVTIEQNGAQAYDAFWGSPVGSGTILNLNVARRTLLAGGLTLITQWSEPMNPAVHPAFVLHCQNNDLLSLPPGTWVDATTYRVEAPNVLPNDPAKQGLLIIMIYNAEDLAGTSLDGNPQTIACRNSDDPTQWDRLEAPPDPTHTLLFTPGGDTLAVRTVLTLDRSGSMVGTKLTNAKRGARVQADLLRSTDQVALVSFADSARVDFSLQPATPANKTALFAAINSLGASGATNIGGALEYALGLLETNQGRDFLTLLSNGEQTTGTPIAEPVATLKALKLPVFTVGVGSDADVATLSWIATETGGDLAYFGSTPDEMPAIFARHLTAARGDGIGLQTIAATITPGQAIQTPVLVDPYTTEATFLVSWDQGPLRVTLQQPDGSWVTPTALPPGAEYVERTDYAFYRIPAPALGSWTLHVRSEAGAATTYSFQNLLRDPGLAVHASAALDANRPDLLHVEVAAVTDPPLVGPSVTGLMERPDGSLVPLVLYDDGQADHGDPVAGDGRFNALFSAVNGAGTYTVTCTLAQGGGLAFTRVVENTVT